MTTTPRRRPGPPPGIRATVGLRLSVTEEEARQIDALAGEQHRSAWLVGLVRRELAQASTCAGYPDPLDTSDGRWSP